MILNCHAGRRGRGGRRGGGGRGVRVRAPRAAAHAHAVPQESAAPKWGFETAELYDRSFILFGKLLQDYALLAWADWEV